MFVKLVMETEETHSTMFLNYSYDVSTSLATKDLTGARTLAPKIPDKTRDTITHD